jgi:hypothetical protein
MASKTSARRDFPTGIQEELRRRLRDTDRFRNDVLHTRIVVIENPHANHIFPDLFRGPFDQRWTWQGEWLTASWVGDSTKQCLASGVPFDVHSGVALILDIDLKPREQPAVAGEVSIL